MTPNEYIHNALRTQTSTYRFEKTGSVTPQLEHAIMGLVTESAECMDAIKKAKIYGKELDTVNLVEEAGDIMWYLAILADELGVSFEQIWEKNIAKLQARYPDKYSDAAAIHRDVAAERTILES